LHVHTPESIVHNYTGGDREDVWKRFLQELEELPREVRVLGINDYIFLDGYRRILRERAGGRLNNIELVLPVIELRVDKFGGARNNKLSRVNFHVIFSDELSPDVIEGQFINALSVDYQLSPDLQGQITWAGIPTRQSLADLGQRIIDAAPADLRRQYATPLEEGFNNLNFSLRHVRQVLESPYFTDKYLTAVGKTEWWDVQWTGTSIAEKRDVINRASLVFISAETPDAWQRARDDLARNNVNARLLDCSDAHHWADATVKDRIGKCSTWISADTTFAGLVRAVHEFEHRVHVGDMPEKLRRVAATGTKFVRSLAIAKLADSNLADPWLDGVELSFNHGLVAIIGNKGSGKSALLDVLALLGDSARHEHASFLTPQRFRRPNDNKAKHFTATLTWEDGTRLERSLDAAVPATAAERVTYVPQAVFDDICNELEGPERGMFDRELSRVIFSHVSQAERYGKSSLEELLAYRTGEVTAGITSRRGELSNLNRQIAALERRLVPDHVEGLQQQLARRRADLAALEAARPTEVPEPLTSSNDERAAAILSRLDEAQEALKATETAIASALARHSLMRQELAVIERVEQRIGTLLHTIASFVENTGPELEPLGITVEGLVRVEVSLAPLEAARRQREIEERALAERTGAAFDAVPAERIDDFPDFDGGPLADGPSSGALPEVELAPEAAAGEDLTTRRDRLGWAVLLLRSMLDAPRRRRQAYLAELADWERRRQAVLGPAEVAGTIAAIDRAIEEVNGLPARLAELRTQRRTIALAIHAQLSQIAELHRTAYASVQRFIAEHDVAREKLALQFNASIVETEFEDRFLEYINRARVGTFSGVPESSARVRAICAACDFNDAEQSVGFAEAIVDQLAHDHRQVARPPMRVGDQLRAGRLEESLYDFVFGFEYLGVRFGLRMGDRALHQLSPGEKGALLLVFYLLVDLDDSPLLIDQPEENLDNQTVVGLLVPSVKRAKRRRQIFMVTHNPNLAVVCDADQIVYASRATYSDPRLTYRSGAIENPEMNRCVVDVLEGTKPAFDMRGATYQPHSDGIVPGAPAPVVPPPDDAVTPSVAAMVGARPPRDAEVG
jgi:ABC-type lipoprotein export system ATPase subunit